LCYCFLFFFTQANSVSLIKDQCGEYKFIVKIFNESDDFQRRFELYFQKNNMQKKLFYKSIPGVNIFTTCVKNKENKYLMMFQESYGGNSGPEDMYGIFDPQIKKMLINPINWPQGNGKEVEKITGSSPLFISDDDGSFFCCFKRQYNNTKQNMPN
jgi:hypothetical protein